MNGNAITKNAEVDNPFNALAVLFADAKAALTELPHWEKAVHLFWLAGPLILLIERSPADIWLSLLALIFLGRSIVKRDRWWLGKFWVRATLLFWGVCLVSAAMSSLPAYSLGEAFIWVRFPLFAMATTFWLGRDRRLLYLMLVSTGFGMLIMCGILTAELILVGQQNGRLTWPYGDHVPGNYLAKAGLPAFVVMVALATSYSSRIARFTAVIALISIVMSVLTGERINFLIRACASMIAAIAWRPKIWRVLLIVVVEVVAVTALMNARPELGNRFVDHFLQQLPTSNESDYYKAMAPGVLAFMQAPTLGVGPGNLRLLCAEITSGHIDLACHPHPHNYYIQIAGETGIFGLLTGVLFLWSIICTCGAAAYRDRRNVVRATMWIVPLGFFWPIASTADFFGQWNNVFMWSALALALAGAHIGSSTHSPTE